MLLFKKSIAVEFYSRNYTRQGLCDLVVHQHHHSFALCISGCMYGALPLRRSLFVPRCVYNCVFLCLFAQASLWHWQTVFVGVWCVRVCDCLFLRVCGYVWVKLNK